MIKPGNACGEPFSASCEEPNENGSGDIIDNGERYLPSYHGVIGLEHLHRYSLAGELVKGKTVLDIACGEGYGAAMLAGHARMVYGVDIMPEVIAHARQKYVAENIEFKVGDCTETLAFDDDFFDVVVSFETIEHHTRHNFMLRELRRVLKPGGVLIISCPDKGIFKAGEGSEKFHKKELTSAEFETLIHRYFSFLKVYEQKVVFGSAILPCKNTTDPACVETVCFDYENPEPEAIIHSRHDGINNAPYRIIVASEDKIAAYSGGLLEQDVNTSEYVRCWTDQMDNAREHIAAIEDYSKRLQKSLELSDNNNAELQNNLGAVKSSMDELQEKNKITQSQLNERDQINDLLRKYIERLERMERKASSDNITLKEQAQLLKTHARELEQSLYKSCSEKSCMESELCQLSLEHSNLSQQYAEQQRLNQMLVSFQNEILASKALLAGKSLRLLYGLLTFRKKILSEELPVVWRKINNLCITCRVKHPVWYRWTADKPLKFTARVIKPFAKAMIKTAPLTMADCSTQGATVKQYDSEYQDNEDFSGLKSDIKPIAFYLPQFHSIPENDKWWGKGFTEWTNTSKAVPRFKEHYQPRVPHRDFGYYDLSDVDTLKKQVSLARQHGIYGFCFYHYWFDGKQLLERPVDLLMKHPEIELNFCLCWANENWTKTWDGMENSILIQQNYSVENDINFIKDLKKYLDDPRYIRVNNKPVVMIYRALELPEPKKAFRRWREWCRENGVGEIEIWNVRTLFSSEGDMGLADAVDQEVEFPPHRIASLEQLDEEKFDLEYGSGFIYDYAHLINDILNSNSLVDKLDRSVIRTAMLGWDNAARREKGWSLWYGFSLERYYNWLRHIIKYTRKNHPESERFIFINAWNEWGEGTYLEPDERYGYASINTTSRAVFDLPCRNSAISLLPVEKEINPGKIAVHAHIFYIDMVAELLAQINMMPYNFDLIVTTDSDIKKQKISRNLNKCRAEKTIIRVTPNKGRDIGPFVAGCRDIIDKYNYVCHIHTKKSATVHWGSLWRKYLWTNLFGSQDNLKAIFQRFEVDTNLGIIFPPPYPVMTPHLNWGGNKAACAELLSRAGLKAALPDVPEFPVGNMFWARCKAIKPLFDMELSFDDFELEKGQIELALQHAIERIWKYLVQGSGYSSLMSLGVQNISSIPDKKRLAVFVHYDKNGDFKESDMHYLRHLRKITDRLIFISNSPVTDNAKGKILKIVDQIKIRDNFGFDFGAWRDILIDVGFDKLGDYDELILMNNSCYAPLFPFADMFDAMEQKECDFWGVTEFPELKNSNRPEAVFLPERTIPKHIQSYFMVFRKTVLESSAFKDFWENVSDKESLLEIVVNYETQLTGVLEKNGFKSACFIEESGLLQLSRSHDPAFNAIYNMPMDFITLRSPFMKKNILYSLPGEQVAEAIDTVRQLTAYPVELISTEKR